MEWIIGENVSSFLNHYKLPLSVVIYTFGTTSNVIIIIIIICNKDKRTVPNMYILNLAISDIINVTVFFFGLWQSYFMWLGRGIMCTFVTFCYRISICLTTYSIAVLSIQRYRVTVNPLHVRVSSQKTWRATGATVFGVWIVALLFTIPLARTNYACGFSMFLLLTNYYQRVAIFHLLVFCVLPLCVIAFSYITMSCPLLTSRCSLSEEKQNALLNTRKNIAKVVLGLTLVFLFSYFPFHISEIYTFSIMNLEKSFDEMLDDFYWSYNFSAIMLILELSLSINSCLNPVALFCTSLAFRGHFKRYLTCCCKAKSPPTVFELTRRN
jgi:hypothetical protein